jgi:hypothetical protein
MNNNEERINHNPEFSQEDENFFELQTKWSITYYAWHVAEALMNEWKWFLERDSAGGVYSDQ